jgi:hypothetical protein
MDNQIQKVMENELIINGVKYQKVEEPQELTCEQVLKMGKSMLETMEQWAKRSEPKELTLEDCVKDNEMGLFYDGGISNKFNKSKRGVCLYPTESIAEKVLLYGLLQSVAYKLNEGVNDIELGCSIICYNSLAKECRAVTYNGSYTIGPIFRTKKLAEQAIRIFENSKFDLKKLFQ